ncbi:MAG: desulfoferrodoxin FeS4 iron-binding domain-containing protein [Nitrospirota bacterium]|nr:desulfoferrodoxin FeS4 iron-binding domain-containing protein [Nitrospirota bacterium]
MTSLGQKYKCNICGNEVVITNTGVGTLVCCGQPMEIIGEGFECSMTK